VARLLDVGRLAPELQGSALNRVLLSLAAALVAAIAIAGVVLAEHYKGSPAALSQVEYHSTEVYGTAPGARLLYFPERRQLVLRAWLLGPAPVGLQYRLWAVRNGSPVLIGRPDGYDFVGLVYAGYADLTGVDQFLVTIEPQGASLSGPNAAPLITLVR
jgi:hypothetical protein